MGDPVSLALYPFPLLNNPPAPTYPEYQALLDEAHRTVPRFVDPANLYPARPVAARRGADWCTAVLGRPNGPYERRSRVEDQMLIVADQADVDPPLPDWIMQARAEGERVQAERDAATRARLQRDADAWAAVLADTTVPLEVHHGSRPRVRGLTSELLRHAVPTADVVSGARRLRVHPAGRALCESEQRSKPLALDGISDGPVTCVRCLDWAPRVRTREGERN